MSPPNGRKNAQILSRPSKPPPRPLRSLSAPSVPPPPARGTSCLPPRTPRAHPRVVPHVLVRERRRRLRERGVEIPGGDGHDGLGRPRVASPPPSPPPAPPSRPVRPSTRVHVPLANRALRRPRPRVRAQRVHVRARVPRRDAPREGRSARRPSPGAEVSAPARRRPRRRSRRPPPPPARRRRRLRLLTVILLFLLLDPELFVRAVVAEPPSTEASTPTSSAYRTAPGGEDRVLRSGRLVARPSRTTSPPAAAAAAAARRGAVPPPPGAAGRRGPRPPPVRARAARAA